MTAYPDCRFCGKTKTYHGPECMAEWTYWATHQVPPYANQHTCTALVGEPGSGKSGGGILLFQSIQQQPFNPREQIYFRPADRIHVARRLAKGMVVYGDESSGEGGHRRRAMSKHNVDNAIDLDTMRQRNQHTVFTAPSLESLDSLIQEACQWVHAFNKNHEVVSYEVIHAGKPDQRYHYLQERFRTQDFPHAEILNPTLWRDYLTMKDDYLAGKDRGGAEKIRAREEKQLAIAQTILRKRPRPKVHALPVHLLER